jgi:hypothetical protein
MDNAPEKEHDGEAAAERRQKVDMKGCGMGIGAEQDDKQPAQHDEQGCSGRMGYLKLVGAADEFTAVPETDSRFTGKDIGGAGDSAYAPPCNDIGLFEVHAGRL